MEDVGTTIKELSFSNTRTLRLEGIIQSIHGPRAVQITEIADTSKYECGTKHIFLRFDIERKN